jgi:hypothetical protein
VEVIRLKSENQQVANIIKLLAASVLPPFHVADCVASSSKQFSKRYKMVEKEQRVKGSSKRIAPSGR